MDVRSARLYGQFSLDKTLTLQAGATVQVYLVPFSNISQNVAFHKIIPPVEPSMSLLSLLKPLKRFEI